MSDRGYYNVVSIVLKHLQLGSVFQLVLGCHIITTSIFKMFTLGVLYSTFYGKTEAALTLRVPNFYQKYLLVGLHIFLGNLKITGMRFLMSYSNFII